MGRFIRIIKADEDESKQEEKKKEGAPKLTQQERAERIELGRKALSPYINSLVRNPPKSGEEIDYDALYDDIIFANNHMLAEAFGLDEAQRYEQKLDDKG